ncbi:MAG TPA: hypothetical protein ENJ01_06855 [Gammaproteobacteria bacterium]|nr:hypothetical protein [Gammaproteobacteria bacterium]
MHDPHINHCVEQLCKQGCNTVRKAIQHLSHGQAPDEVRRLSPAQQREVLRELRAIMAVYDRRERGCE